MELGAALMNKPEPLGHPVFHCKVYSDSQWGYIAVCPFVGAFFACPDPKTAMIRLAGLSIPLALHKMAWERRN